VVVEDVFDVCGDVLELLGYLCVEWVDGGWVCDV